jgi:hypothetical protein
MVLDYRFGGWCAAFSGFAVIGVILAIRNRDPHNLATLLCLVPAYRAWEPLRMRIWGPGPEVPPLDIDF